MPNNPGYATRLGASGDIFSPVSVTEASSEIRVERDVEIPARDGTILRANLYRPPGSDRYQPLITYRLLRQTGRIKLSSYTGWEAPDPAVWVKFGYAVVNADMRGFFRSEGEARLLTEQEGQDYYDLIEWAASRDWCTGKVGLSGVSYLALTQWRPPSLAAICPWEGFTDVCRDLAFPGWVTGRGYSTSATHHLGSRNSRVADVVTQFHHTRAHLLNGGEL